MKPLFTVSITYSEVTPESASIGDFSDTGFLREDETNWRLKDIIKEVENQGVEYIQDNHNSLSVYGGFSIRDYYNGIEREECIHIDASPRNIKRILSILNK